MAVTTPLVVRVSPTRGLVLPLPWISGMEMVAAAALTVTSTVQLALWASLLVKSTRTG